jgi:hypothetical protein
MNVKLKVMASPAPEKFITFIKFINFINFSALTHAERALALEESALPDPAKVQTLQTLRSTPDDGITRHQRPPLLAPTGRVPTKWVAARG